MLFAAAPLLAGVRNLSVGETARLLDFYVVLPGMLLLIPVFLPEQDKAIRDLIRAGKDYDRRQTSNKKKRSRGGEAR